jgi:hypothetical protein
MSFGFGVGDFITVLQLADKIRARFVDAPSQLRELSNEYVTSDFSPLPILIVPSTV